MGERYFYHSFPRRKNNNQIDKGLSILKSIVENGILLTPEITTWYEHFSNGSCSEPAILFQKRICFTELSRDEIKNHNKIFGSFSLEFEISELIKLHAIPVFYIPNASLAQYLIFRHRELHIALNKIETIKEFINNSKNKNDLISLGTRGDKPKQIQATLEAVEILFKEIFSGGKDSEELNRALSGLSGLFYPTERGSDLLHYYKQREWRIIANIIHNDNPITQVPNSFFKEQLLKIDQEFFGGEKKFPSGTHKLVDQCQSLKIYQNKHILEYASKIIVPKEAINEAKKLVSILGNPPIIETI